MNLIHHIHRQRAFSSQTFGPEFHAEGLLAHIKKELEEISQDPHDLIEWIDVVILALEGAWRSGHTPEQISAALQQKQGINESRTWPDWRTVPDGEPIEHIRSDNQA